MFESHAQNSEDVVLWRALGHIEHGTYVDVGAADPDEDSVTKAFYERGWTGINVEPAEDYADRLRRARPNDLTLQLCAGQAAGTMTFHHVLGTGLSSVVDVSIDSLVDTEYETRDVEVEVQRLDQILEDAGFDSRDIHFLKVDVEGFEESVLRGIDLQRWRPWVIVAEATAPRSTTLVHHAWEPILLEGGYSMCLFDGLNRFYVADEHADLRDRLSYPAGVFDQPYSTPAHATLLREYDNLLRGNHELGEQHRASLRAYDVVNDELQKTIEAYHRVELLHNTAIESYQRLHDEYENERLGNARLKEAYDDLDAVASQRGDDLDRLRAENDTLRHGVASMSAEFDSLRYARDQAQHELELTRRTVSWRLTRPLRMVRQLRGH